MPVKSKYPYYPYDAIRGKGKLWYMFGHTHGKYWMQLSEGHHTKQEVITMMKRQLHADKATRRELYHEFSGDIETTPQGILEKITRRREKLRHHYAPLFGRQVTVGIQNPVIYELVDVNDLGIPYWVKVVRGKKQKSQYTLAFYGKDWLDKEMAITKRKRPQKVSRIPRTLPPDAQNVQELPFDKQLFTCYGIPTTRGFRAYCRRKGG